jgi:hypothetical protein
MEEIEFSVFKQFYKLHKEEMSVTQFEDWLYNEPHLENMMEKVIYKHIPFSYFECYRLKDNLKSVIYGEGDLVELLEGFYHDYCDGYSYFRFIGMRYLTHGFENMLRIIDVADVNAAPFLENRKGLLK